MASKIINSNKTFFEVIFFFLKITIHKSNAPRIDDDDDGGLVMRNSREEKSKWTNIGVLT